MPWSLASCNQRLAPAITWEGLWPPGARCGWMRVVASTPLKPATYAASRRISEPGGSAVPIVLTLHHQPSFRGPSIVMGFVVFGGCCVGLSAAEPDLGSVQLGLGAESGASNSRLVAQDAGARPLLLSRVRAGVHPLVRRDEHVTATLDRIEFAHALDERGRRHPDPVRRGGVHVEDEERVGGGVLGAPVARCGRRRTDPPLRSGS